MSETPSEEAFFRWRSMAIKGGLKNRHTASTALSVTLALLIPRTEFILNQSSAYFESLPLPMLRLLSSKAQLGRKDL